MSYQILTDAYQGPIDLLYDLVVADRIDSSSLSLSPLVEDFLSELARGVPVELEHLSQFVLVLALLCRLKAKRMLSAIPDSPQEGTLENPDRELWHRLAQRTFGEAVAELEDLLERRSGMRPREAGPDWSNMGSTPELAFHLDPGRLAELAGKIMSRVRAAPDLDHLALDLPTVEQAISELWHLIVRLGESSFEQVAGGGGDRATEAVRFMGLMELARRGKVSISQDKPTEDIHIRLGRTEALAAAAAGGSR